MQNKVLKAMAMARPIVATLEAFEGLRARPGRDLLVADGASAMARRVDKVLDGTFPRPGAATRAAITKGQAWNRSLAALYALLPTLPSAGAPGAQPGRMTTEPS